MLKRTEAAVDEKYLHVKPMLPDVNDPRERENRITEDRGVVFVIGIGGELADGTIHDGRTPDEEMARRCKNAGVMLL